MNSFVLVFFPDAFSQAGMYMEPGSYINRDAEEKGKDR